MAAYSPNARDIIDFLQSVATEQAGRRPALVLSPLAFNKLTGQCVEAIMLATIGWLWLIACCALQLL